MPVAKWIVQAPGEFFWTPAELAQIGRAIQAFQAALPNADGKLHHSVALSGVGLLDASHLVTWPQPETPREEEDRRTYPRGERPPHSDERP